MDKDTLHDLKQFIATRVSQATADLATRKDIIKLEKKVDDLELKVDTYLKHYTSISPIMSQDL